MTDTELKECVEIGLGYVPTEQEVRDHLWARSGRKLSEAEQVTWLESRLSGSPGDWRLKVLGLIRQIPKGSLVSYGVLAARANREFGLSIGPRNAGWLRKRIYHEIGHDTEIPIHRVANAGDAHSTRDHPITQEINRRKRGREGSFPQPTWVAE